MYAASLRQFGPALLSLAFLVTVGRSGTGFARPPSPPIASAELSRAIDDFGEAAIRNHTTAGMIVGITDHGRPLLIKGYGSADLENMTPVAADTVFRVGSVTKQFTAAAILILAERGRLSIDDPVSRFFPGFPRGGEVTVRNLLNHTSGIHNYTSEKDFLTSTSRRDLTAAQYVDLIAHLDPLYDFAPGTSFGYSNSGYMLLGAIIEQVSGQSYATFLKANVLTPAGLADTQVDDLSQIVPHRARGYEAAAAAPTGFVNAEYISMSAAGAAGAVRSTAADLLRWHSALLGGTLLKPASRAMMLTPGRLKNGALASSAVPPAPGTAEPRLDYGFGLFAGQTKGHRSIGHGGAINGFSAVVTTFPDEALTLVLLTNTGGAASSLSVKLEDIVFAYRAPAAPAARP